MACEGRGLRVLPLPLLKGMVWRALLLVPFELLGGEHIQGYTIAAIARVHEGERCSLLRFC